MRGRSRLLHITVFFFNSKYIDKLIFTLQRDLSDNFQTLCVLPPKMCPQLCFLNLDPEFRDER